MESKSIVIHKGGKEEKYKLYVEDYVLSYLKYETGSLEFSEIYFYGVRKKIDREYVVYGAGRDKQIPVFDAYDLLEEIICRLTQAGPVFMVREEEEIYQIKGFDIFYQDNEAMQSYMVERTKNFSRSQKVEQTDRHSDAVPPSGDGMGRIETKSGHAHGVMSAQLCVILIIMLAIVINSANSYDKMEQLNRSTEEVFFAIENQEADDSVTDTYEPAEEIVVERNKDQASERSGNQENDDNNLSEDGEEEQQAQTENGAAEEAGAEKVNSEDGEEGTEDTNPETALAETKEDIVNEEGILKDVSGTETEQEDDEDIQTEALSRNVTRYYKVEKGDTLYTICEKIYGDISQVEKICELNDISDPDRIRSGQKIILP